ncbi:thiol:disulfide interchange protein DsbA/DsbL [Aquabacterium sp. A7-Y]|nr:thiol:disulfide interchange protein DsbA/DsbL [Aquabacterium sp. A7-Y]
MAAWVGGAAVAPWLAGTAVAQAAFQAGKDYVELRQQQPTSTPQGVEVVEFFWYGCPHCHRFEPLLEAWVKKLPADVRFRRVPVAFRDEFVVHQRIYYALEALGQVEPVHKRVFHAIHVERKSLDEVNAIADWMAANGVDRAKFLEAYNSFGVQTKTRQAKQLADGFRIDGVPALGINGRYWTSGSVAGSLERSLQVADHLIALSRRK